MDALCGQTTRVHFLREAKLSGNSSLLFIKFHPRPMITSSSLALTEITEWHQRVDSDKPLTGRCTHILPSIQHCLAGTSPARHLHKRLEPRLLTSCRGWYDRYRDGCEKAHSKGSHSMNTVLHRRRFLQWTSLSMAGAFLPGCSNDDPGARYTSLDIARLAQQRLDEGTLSG